MSVEAQKRDFNRRLCLNRAIFKNPYWVLPVDNVGHSNFMPVGRGLRTSPVCARHIGIMTCKNFAEHEGFVGGFDCTGKVVVRHRHLWCHKSSCPVCFIRGWSVRGARSIEGRLIEGVNRGFRKVEHVMVSVAVADRGLSESDMRLKCRNALFDRGIIGGTMIFHGFRADKKRDVLVWSPHYHCLGFIFGGFDRCRECNHLRTDCSSCDGLKGREVRGYANDGIIVKVLAERKTVFGTAFYQLNHASIRVGIVRFHVVTWFGVCGTRMYKSVSLVAEVLCPVCKAVMVRSVYMGSRLIIKNIGHRDYVPWFVDDEFDENGVPLYVDV